MKTGIPHAIIASALLALSPAAFAAPAATAKTEFMALFEKIQDKMEKGADTEKALADEIREFDAILARHPDEKTDDVAQVLFMKGTLYLQVFTDADKALEIMAQLQKDFPNTKYGKEATGAIAEIRMQADALRIQKSLVVGSPFPAFAVKDTAGAELSLAAYKGKVVMIDFWAMWCPPCLEELPNVVAAYKKYHDKGFEIIGVSLDKAGDGPALAKFTKEKEMPWKQFFDGKYWQNELAVKYGVHSIPATYLLDGEGNIIAKDLREGALAAALEKALAPK